jgi:membrane fusion protein (multidrug efflux system)
MAFKGNRDEYERIELNLPGGSKFNQTGKIGAIEAQFNNETGNIAFRADFPNPDGLLRHGQTGTVVIHHVLKDAVVIPQRAKFEILAKQYVFVVSDEKGEDTKDKDADKEKDGAKDKEKSKAKNEEQDKDEETADGSHERQGVVRQREIVIGHELDDIYVIEKGLKASDQVMLEGIRQVRDGDKVEYQYITPEKALEHLKFHAE